jgi:hypothetical protein
VTAGRESEPPRFVRHERLPESIEQVDDWE